MRVLNDREEKTQPSELGFLSVAAHALLSAVGIATVFLGPLPMIIAHVRLAEPWPKLAAVSGAVIALTFLEVPMPLVLLVFIFGVYVADAVSREVDFWPLARNAVLLATVLGIGALLIGSQIEKTDLVHYWTSLVDMSLVQLQKAMHVEKNFQWEVLRGILLYEGPFLYLSGVVLSFWLSIGIAAHMGWLPEGHRFSGAELRQIRLPAGASLVFMLLFVGAFFGSKQVQHVFGGAFRLAGAIMFVQGCICLSELLTRRMVQPRTRTLIYSVAILLGFYVLMGIGVISPWLFRKKEKLEEML